MEEPTDLNLNRDVGAIIPFNMRKHFKLVSDGLTKIHHKNLPVVLSTAITRKVFERYNRVFLTWLLAHRAKIFIWITGNIILPVTGTVPKVLLDQHQFELRGMSIWMPTNKRSPLWYPEWWVYRTLMQKTSSVPQLPDEYDYIAPLQWNLNSRKICYNFFKQSQDTLRLFEVYSWDEDCEASIRILLQHNVHHFLRTTKTYKHLDWVGCEMTNPWIAEVFGDKDSGWERNQITYCMQGNNEVKYYRWVKNL